MNQSTVFLDWNYKTKLVLAFFLKFLWKKKKLMKIQKADKNAATVTLQGVMWSGSKCLAVIELMVKQIL